VPDQRYMDDPHIRGVIEQLIDEGWRRVERGHGYSLRCPCGQGRVRFDGLFLGGWSATEEGLW